MKESGCGADGGLAEVMRELSAKGIGMNGGSCWGSERVNSVSLRCNY
jgi:hypothetical protein